jgi:hypothetical protein
MGLGEEIIEQSRAGIAKMDAAGGRWGKTNDCGHFVF